MARDFEYFPHSNDDELTRLKARIAELEALNHELEEERRWRKCCECLPLKGQRVLFLAKYKTDNVREWIGDFRHVDGVKSLLEAL